MSSGNHGNGCVSHNILLNPYLPRFFCQNLGTIQESRKKKIHMQCHVHLEALITVHVHKGLYLGNRFIDIVQIWKECRQDMCYHMPIIIIAK